MRLRFTCALVFVLAMFTASYAADFAHGPADSITMPPGNRVSQTMLAGDKLVTFRSWLEIPYVNNPVEPDYQKLNIYVPEEYFHGGTVNGYTAKTAPIFMPNGVGGYMPGRQFIPANEVML